MKKTLITIAGMMNLSFAFSQEKQDTVFKKRALEAAEIEILGSYYSQDGAHSAVNGGIGTEKLEDYTSNIILNIPLNSDDVLTVDAGFSAYTSASSSNINPFMSRQVSNNTRTGASRSAGLNTTEDGNHPWIMTKASSGGEYSGETSTGSVNWPYGSPWIASTGASRKDVLKSGSFGYSHKSESRNHVISGHASYSKEYDYRSIGFGAGYTWLFNRKNSELAFKGSVYLDKWNPIYPTELHEYSQYGFNFQKTGYFSNVQIYDQNGNISARYLPKEFKEFTNSIRNLYALTVSFSQILSKNIQVSFFADVIYQKGLLSTPYHRIYFSDRPNYYIGDKKNIPIYTSDQNLSLYRLSDDVERLPDTRLKLPVGMRANIFLNEKFSFRTYYRFYWDDWGMNAHTLSLEMAYKLKDFLVIIPTYRYYVQKEVKYFAAFEKHYSFQKYYTSDYDLSTFDSHQLGLGISYRNLLGNAKIWSLGLKSIDLRYQHYMRSDHLNANIISLGIKLVK